MILYRRSKYFFLTFPYLLSLLVCLPAAANNQITVSPGVLYFDFHEREIDGTEILRESGIMLGVNFAYKSWLQTQSYFQLDFGLSLGEVDYDGQILETGEPLNSDTDQTFFDFGGELGTRMNWIDASSFVYGRLDYKIWDRSINSTPQAIGLHEIYTWWQIGAGLKVPVKSGSTGDINVDIQFFKTINPEMEVNLWFWEAGKPIFALEEKTGWQIKLNLLRPVDSKRAFDFAFLYRFWEFGRSDTRLIDTNEGPKNLFEPDSESEIFMFQVVMQL